MNPQPLSAAFRHAWNGVVYFFRYDRNGRIHLVAAILVLVAAWYFSVSAAEWCVLLLCIGLVLALEMMNHGLEKLCDMVHNEWHPVIKVVKDVSAAGVLIASICSAAVGLIIFIPKIQALL